MSFFRSEGSVILIIAISLLVVVLLASVGAITYGALSIAGGTLDILRGEPALISAVYSPLI